MRLKTLAPGHLTAEIELPELAWWSQERAKAVGYSVLADADFVLLQFNGEHVVSIVGREHSAWIAELCSDDEQRELMALARTTLAFLSLMPSDHWEVCGDALRVDLGAMAGALGEGNVAVLMREPRA